LVGALVIDLTRFRESQCLDKYLFEKNLMVEVLVRGAIAPKNVGIFLSFHAKRYENLRAMGTSEEAF
jgi:hypothetical protein